jgi:hypothetical protein
MIGKVLQSALCLLLSPLLAAQHVAQTAASSSSPQPGAPAATSLPATPPVPEAITIPKGTAIGLIELETASSATASKGDPVRYVVAEDIVVDGVTAIRAGTPVTGTVTKAKKSSTHHQEGELEIAVRELALDSQIRLRLTDQPPKSPAEQSAENSELVKGVLLGIVLAPVWIALLAIEVTVSAPFAIAGVIDDLRQQSASPQWTDVTLAQCSTRMVYVSSETTIPRANLAAQANAPAAPEDSPCAPAPAPAEPIATKR